ncbi:MAG: hypothetical protein M1484_02295 [Patescibacteria group bacterium]|nr:hypothetical protein [Patescibacteria group bacterium]
MGELTKSQDEQVSDPLVEELIKSIPAKDRQSAIQQASARRQELILKVWIEERTKLNSKEINKLGLTQDLAGWEKYLRWCFEQEDKFRKKYGFDDWSRKYLAQMLSDRQEDVHKIERESKYIRFFGKTSFREYYFNGSGVNPEIWMGPAAVEIDSNSLLVHSINSFALSKVAHSGFVGRGGNSMAAMCQDRVVYDRGYIIIWQTNELEAAGYPLMRINEDPRDAKILKEWRSPVPVDVHLARLIVPTSDIPDRENASRAQIATSYFGEEYLRQIPRL